jgi:hypothetical protein
MRLKSFKSFVNENWDLLSQFKGNHHGSKMDKNRYLNSLGLDESGIETIQIIINLLKEDESWFNSKFPNGASYVDVIKYVEDKVGNLPNFIISSRGKNPIYIVNSLK